MKKISDIIILGYNDLELNEKSFIGDLITCIDYHDFIFNTDINEKIAQISIIEKTLYLFYRITPEEKDVKTIEGLKDFMYPKYQCIREINHLNINKVKFETNEKQS